MRALFKSTDTAVMQPMVNIALRAAREAGEMIVKSADNLEVIKVVKKAVMISLPKLTGVQRK